MLVLVGECAVYVAVWVWPQCLGLNIMASELTNRVQKGYGVADHEYLTAAIDLMQAMVSIQVDISRSIPFEDFVFVV